ncbi:MAG TPA: SDR family NAD(P)-dependent oxidoreductase [Burkholderiaceae bacterium]|nr:SDR family NAD(P)-dependent oxidoreductase [Burkholderiaceae bacterium]HQR71444.1 SDR family NAD(P)-dependent oxidoreductase [Burkholderiaceae bacterium]
MASNGCVLITGAAGHLGHAVAAHFSASGVPLALLDRQADALESLARDLPGSSVLPLSTDLLDPAAVAAAVSRAVDLYGGIAAAINLAGGFAMGDPVHATPAAVWQRMLDLNVNTMLHSCAAVVPVMQRAGRGAIVNVGAASALRGAANMGAYIASKSALMRLTESMAAELREHGINVNAVLPSVIDTPANRASMPDADPRRWVAPQDLAAVIGFLASEAARAIHGALIPVTGLS